MAWVNLIKGKLSKETVDAAAWDIASSEDSVIKPGEIKVIKTDIITEMSDDLYCEIWDKSGLASRGITTRAGVIDSKYPKEWGVVLANESKEPFIIKKGDRIAQAIFKYKDGFGRFDKNSYYPKDLQGEFIIKDVQRTGGFGSTGNK